MAKGTVYRSGHEWPSARRLRGKFRHAAFVALAGLLPPLLGLPVLSWQVRQAIEAEAAGIHEFVATRIAAIFTHANNAAGEVTSLVGSSCASAGLGLRLGVTAHPFVRSLNLAENGRIYCSSLEGSVDYAEEAEAYADGRLRLMPGNQVTPSRALVVYRQATQSGSVLVGIDGQHLFDVLSLGVREFTVQVGIKGNWVGPKGVATAAFEGTGEAVASFIEFDRLSIHRRGRLRQGPHLAESGDGILAVLAAACVAGGVVRLRSPSLRVAAQFPDSRTAARGRGRRIRPILSTHCACRIRQASRGRSACSMDAPKRGAHPAEPIHPAGRTHWSDRTDDLSSDGAG